MSIQTTTIIPVIDAQGATVTAEAWGRPNSVLFEIVDGPHAGKRGPDTEIYDLVGHITVNWTQASDYATGNRRPFTR